MAGEFEVKLTIFVCSKFDAMLIDAESLYNSNKLSWYCSEVEKDIKSRFLMSRNNSKEPNRLAIACQT